MFFIYCLAKVLSYVPFIGPKLTIVKQLPLVWLGKGQKRQEKKERKTASFSFQLIDFSIYYFLTFSIFSFCS